MSSCEHFVQCLSNFSQNGEAIRIVIAETLTDPNLYSALVSIPCADAPSTSGSSSPTTASRSSWDQAFAAVTHEKYLRAIKDLPPPKLNFSASLEPDAVPRLFSEPLQHGTFLDELVFWTIRQELLQKLVCLLLNVMLPSPDFKEALTRAFVAHYSRMTQLVVSSKDCNAISNSMVHISVQIFSNADLALLMSREMGLMHIMILVLNALLENHKLLIKERDNSSWEGWGPGTTGIVDCRSRIMKDHCYWPMVSDFNNVLGHFGVAKSFMEDPQLLTLWFRFLSMFQCMNLNQRQLLVHLEYEPNTYYAAFSAEIEASASPMWALISHLTGPSTLNLSKVRSDSYLDKR